MLVEDVAKKIGELDREVKYLINKAKVFRPKEKKEKKTKKSNETKTEEKTGAACSYCLLLMEKCGGIQPFHLTTTGNFWKENESYLSYL